MGAHQHRIESGGAVANCPDIAEIVIARGEIEFGQPGN